MPVSRKKYREISREYKYIARKICELIPYKTSINISDCGSVYIFAKFKCLNKKDYVERVVMRISNHESQINKVIADIDMVKRKDIDAESFISLCANKMTGLIDEIKMSYE